MAPGSQVEAILDLQSEAPVVMGDRFILRSFSPVATIGGGTVLDVDLPTRWKAQKLWVQELAGAEELQRLLLLIGSRGARPFTLSALARRLGRSEDNTRHLLPKEVLQPGRSEDPWLLTAHQAEELDHGILGAVERFHQAQPYSHGANREFIRQQIGGDERFLEHWLIDMVARGELASHDESWRLPSFSIDLAQTDEDLLNRLVEAVKSQGFETEYLEELAAHLGAKVESLHTLLAMAEEQGQLVRVNRRILLHTEARDRLVDAVRRHFRQSPELTVADLKKLTGTTRKYAVPLLEYLDQQGHTVRVGDKRVQPDG
ncbi:MAG: SelB C-terminal domain-containing protein [Candidatus Neomarinimicrobiota bacterium]